MVHSFSADASGVVFVTLTASSLHGNEGTAHKCRAPGDGQVGAGVELLVIGKLNRFCRSIGAWIPHGRGVTARKRCVSLGANSEEIFSRKSTRGCHDPLFVGDSVARDMRAIYCLGTFPRGMC